MDNVKYIGEFCDLYSSFSIVGVIISMIWTYRIDEGNRK
jgi:hypothetical protein